MGGRRYWFYPVPVLALQQNAGDLNYLNMSPNYDQSIAFKTACELVFQGKDQPSGYTEPLLHLNRLIKKN